MEITALSTAKLSNDGVLMLLRHPVTNEQLDAGLVLRGKDSKEYRKLTQEFRAQAMRQKMDDPMAMAEKRGKDSRVACTVDWVDMAYNGESKFSHELVRQMYDDEGLQWIVDQVDQFIQDRANFLPKA